MTVCIAAKSNDGFIFAVADRMATVGDVEFESSAPKILGLTTSIYVLTSDNDAALHAEILQDLSLTVHNMVHKSPSEWLEVETVAEMYLKFRNEAKRRRAERDILLPLGLTSESFINRQHEMNGDFITAISNQLINYSLPLLSVIFCGYDKIGSHIYVIHDNDIGCYNGIGYAAIGSGASHANSQFMLHGHSTRSTTADTIFVTYLAKKRAEIAPGVGIDTDTLLLTSLGVSATWNADLIKKVELEYQRMIKREGSAQSKAKGEIGVYVQRIRDQAAAAATTGAPSQEVDKSVGEGNPTEER